MSTPLPKSEDKRLSLMLALICGVIIVRLLVEANASANWKGFAFSTAHLLIVAWGTHYALRSDRN